MEKLNSEYEVDVPTAESSEEHTDNIAPNSKDKTEETNQPTLKKKSVIKTFQDELQVGQKHQTSQK